MAKLNYIGCDSAASATAMIISRSSYWNKYDRVTYCGTIEEAINCYSIGVKTNEYAHFALSYYEIYVKDQDTKKWVEIEVADEIVESIWASSPINPANKPVIR